MIPEKIDRGGAEDAERWPEQSEPRIARMDMNEEK